MARPTSPWVILPRASSILPLSPPAVIQVIPPKRKYRRKAKPPTKIMVCQSVAIVTANCLGESAGLEPPGTAVLVIAAWAF